MPAGRDAWTRVWVKFPTYVLEQPEYQRLSFKHFGIFTKAILHSVRASQTPGYFLDLETGRVRTLEEIAYRIKPDTQDPIGALQDVRQAFDELQQAKLIEWTDESGFSFVTPVFEQFLHENNRIAYREAAARRQRNKRARDKSQREATPPRRPVPLRRHGQGQETS